MKQWTIKEKSLLKRAYKNTPNSILSQNMNRSRSAVNHKALELGLSKNQANRNYGTMRDNRGKCIGGNEVLRLLG